MPTPKVRFPESAAKGEIIEIKTLIDHDMESGQRKDMNGVLLPRRIINRFTCALNGRVVFTAELHPGISANPGLNFFITASESGTLDFTWFDDDGSRYALSRPLAVK